MRLKSVVAILIFVTSLPLLSQVKESASQGGWPVTIGIGFSDYYSDWNGRLDGATLWADWNFNHGPSFLHGFGIEVEGRDLNFGRTGVVPNLRQDTVEGGPIYTWRHYRNFHPYTKFLLGFGSIDFEHLTPTYSHDTRIVIAPGGGGEYRAWRNVWVRGDYEYQFWPDFFHHHAMNPQGFTVGASYDFRHIHSR